MEDLSHITPLLDNIRGVSGLVRELVSVMGDRKGSAELRKINAMILDAQQFALSAQHEQFELRQKMLALQEEIKALREFGEEKKKYELRDIVGEAFVYALVENSGLPPHWLCSKCFEQGQKSIVQLCERYRHHNIWKCYCCSSEIRVPVGTVPSRD